MYIIYDKENGIFSIIKENKAMKYDYLIVGSGLFGSVFAYEAMKYGSSCLVIDKRPHIGGNIYTSVEEGITVHQYGAHIFHTSDKEVWDYINQFADFNNYIHSPIALYKNELYNLPFNMNTFAKLWDITMPYEAKEIIDTQRNKENISIPRNLEEYAIYFVGHDGYKKIIKGYTEKQWGRPCKDLPISIIGRIPIRFTYNNNYFDDIYQGIPVGGYTQIIEKMLRGADIILNTEYRNIIKDNPHIDKKIVYTGMIDEFFNYEFGALEYRSLEFKTKVLDTDNYQGTAVINYTDSSVPYTRVIEHKHFENSKQKKTVITYEYPVKWNKNREPYYPVNIYGNNILYNKYMELAKKKDNVIFGGRLGNYQYYNMDKVIKLARDAARNELNN